MTDAPEKFTKNDVRSHPNPNCLWVRLTTYEQQQARIVQLDEINARWKSNSQDTYFGLCAMRDDINNVVPRNGDTQGTKNDEIVTWPWNGKFKPLKPRFP